MSDSRNSLQPKGKKTLVEKLTEYLVAEQGTVFLSDEEEELLLRLHEVDRMMMKEPPRIVVNMIMGRYPDVSKSTAYRYLDYARQLFNAVSTGSDPDFGTRLVLEWIYEARDLAIATKDSKAMVSLIRTMCDVFGLKDRDGNAIDPEKLEQHQYILQLNFFGQQDKAQKQTIDITNLQRLPVPLKDQVVQDVHEHMFPDMREVLNPKPEDDGEEAAEA